MHVNDVVKTNGASDLGGHVTQRQDAAVPQPDADHTIAALAAPVEDNGRLPMHVGQRQAQLLKRLLPGRQRSRRAGRAVLFAQEQFLYGVADIGFRAAELRAAGSRLIAREPLLQRRLGFALQGRVDGRVHGVGLGGQAGDTVRLSPRGRESR